MNNTQKHKNVVWSNAYECQSFRETLFTGQEKRSKPIGKQDKEVAEMAVHPRAMSRQWLSNGKSSKDVTWLSHQWKWLCHCQRWGGHGRVVPFPPPFRNTRMDEPKTDKATCPRHLLPMTHPHCTVESINENWYYFTCRECELSF